MSLLGDLRNYTRFAWGLHGYFRHTITLEEARATVRRRIATREERFLCLFEKGILGSPRSPYRRLLEVARCEPGDVRSLVRSRGLEGALLALREGGVYVTFEEFKGREPIVRDGHVIPVQAEDFDNPYLSRFYQAESSGTTGAGTRVSLDLDHYTAQAPLLLLSYDAHGLLGVPRAIWSGTLPDSTGIGNILVSSPFRNVPERWFEPVAPGGSQSALMYRLANRTIIATGRLMGLPIPWPEPVGLDQAATVARWAEATLRSHGSCLVSTHVSQALRVCVAAREEGLDLTGVVFWGGGEPPTRAKIREIERVGARIFPSYWFKEAGCVGQGCCRPADGNDIHLFRDALALVQYPRQVPGAEDVTVQAFHFTGLLPTAPKLLLNVESDDYGILEERSCGCPLGEIGFTQHLRNIRSYRKLSGEGVTLVGSEMVAILEEVLPARFGGSPLDYQFLEEEDEHGFTRLSLVVSPRVEIPDDEAIVAAVLEAMGRSSGAADMARALWNQAGTLRVKRAEPVWTGRGKLVPLHLGRRPGASRR